MTPKIQPASTIAICKITTKWPFKILALKRSEKAQFLPGAYVFPGGRLDPSDNHLATFFMHDQVNATRISSFFGGSAKDTLAHLACAIRECFEETGISLLKLKSLDNSISYDIFALKQWLTAAQIPKAQTPVLDNLFPISWWITPEGEVRRYNTWFFLGLIADEIEPIINNETSDALWLYPDEALDAYAKGHMFFAPPTRTILERMNSTASLTDFLTYVDKPLFPIEPFFVEEQGQKILILPGDALHHQPKKSLMPKSTRYPF